jgi:CBS domain-containing protein
MEEIIGFLIQHPPFRQLPLLQIQRLAGIIQIESFSAGYEVLTQGGKPATHLYIVRRGAVDLLRRQDDQAVIADTLEAGEMFGYISLIRGRPPIMSARAHADTLAYLIPAATFHQMRRDYPAFAQFFARSLTDWLDQALQARHADAAPDLFRVRLLDIANRPAVTVPPTATVRSAAILMRERNVSCLVVESRPPGILTDRDLRNHVLAAGLIDATPVAQVMSAPALTLPAESLVFEGLLLMLERKIHHLPVTQNGHVAGVVTQSDILRRQSHSPLFLPHLLDRAQTIDDLRAYADQVATMIGRLFDSGARVADIGRMVAVAHDALLVHMLRRAEAELGSPPCRYAWLVLGSEGRYEQMLRTDQDNALIYADNAPPDAPAYFAALAERIVDQLVACGFPRCTGDIMATNPQWRQSLGVWQGYFQQWINQPDPESLLRVAIFFDYRQVYGSLDAEAALRPIILRAREQRVFLGRLARAALQQTASLGWLQQLGLERKGDTFDLKMRGTGLVVDLGRLFGLEAGVTTTNTINRLRQAAAGDGELSSSGAEELVAAFELISLMRLRHQLAQIRSGAEPSNLIVISQLSPLERRELKGALRAISAVQSSVELTFRTAMMA